MINFVFLKFTIEKMEKAANYWIETIKSDKPAGFCKICQTFNQELEETIGFDMVSFAERAVWLEHKTYFRIWTF